LRLYTIGPKSLAEGLLANTDRAINAVVFSRDGKVIVTGGADRALHYWNASDLSEILKVPAHDAAITALAVPPG